MSDDNQYEATALQGALDTETDIEGHGKSRDRTALVNAKRPAVRLAEGSQPALDQRRIGQNPAVQDGMVHRQAALPEQLLDVAIAQGIAQIPRDGLQDQRGLKVAALEVVLGPTLQLLGNRPQDHGVPPNRGRQSRPPCPTSRQRQKFATDPLKSMSSYQPHQGI